MSQRSFQRPHYQGTLRLPASHDDMVELLHTISHRIAKYLEKVGIVQRDMENSYLNLPIDDEDSLLNTYA